MNIGVVCAAALGLLLFGLGLYISILRQGRGVLVGHDPDPGDRLHRAVRAHANTAEFAPFLAILFLWHAIREPAAWINAVILAATIARFLLVAGLLFGNSLGKANAARFVGALLTYLCGIALAAALLAT
jgi:uncharacterized membrane protein YecN with MAPEG domain